MARQLKRSWYDSFIECTAPHTEAPTNYLFWSALSVLGGVLKNYVFYEEGVYTIYPNQYIILTGPPGIGKGTAINFAWSLVKDPNNTYPLANMISDRVTAPRILQRIATGWPQKPVLVNNQQILASREHTCTMFSTELRVLLTASDWMLEFLCESWDRNTYDYDTKNMGSSIIKDMCTSLIGGTVPDYIRGMERDVDASVAGGFTARCIFVFADKKSKSQAFTPPLKKDPKSLALYEQLRNDLLHISNLRGEFTLSPEARIVFENYYPAITPLPEDTEAMLNFKSRMKTHIFKVAMILSVARKDALIINGQDMRDAIHIINSIKKQLNSVFRGVGASPQAEATAKVQQLIERFGRATRNEIFRAVHRDMTPETLDRVLYVLLTIGWCQEHHQNGRIYYAPTPTKKVGGIKK